MNAWRKAYSVIGIYIGGVNSACDYGNLSAAWIRATAAAGWSTLPIYVGPQPPCSASGVTINPRQAAAEGGAAAANAVSDASLFGLPKGSPVYYDLEAYDEDDGSCVSAVLAFLGAWTRQLNASGYVSGVYSSQDSGIADMQSAAQARQPGFTPSQAIWIALWDGKMTLSDGSLGWPLSERTKQYEGPHTQQVGGVSLDIDSDYVGGPVAP